MRHQALPRWNLETLLPGNSPRHTELSRLVSGIATLEAHYNQHGISTGAALPTSPEQITLFDTTMAMTSEIVEQHRILSFYWAGRCWADGTDRESRTQAAALREATSTLPPLLARLRQWATRFDRARLTAASSIAASHTYWLERAQSLAQHQLSEAQESLLAELAPTSADSWRALHGNLISTLTASEGGGAEVPISVLRSQLGDHDPDRRRGAHDALQQAWRSIAVPAAACLNAIRGGTLVLARHRGWADPLDISLDANGIDAKTLDLVHEAVHACILSLRRFAAAKAGILGCQVLRYWDIQAPLPSEPRISWEEALDLISRAVAPVSGEFSDLVRRADRESWIDAEPRPHKRQTALTMPTGRGTSRILVNFSGTMDDVLSLAHELGHAYHYHLLRDAGPLQRIPSLAVAETASLMTEHLLLDAAESTPHAVSLMNAELIGHFQVIVDTHSRYVFESEYIKQRTHAPLAPEEISALLHQAQLSTYGDSVVAETLDRYGWISKPHYYADTPYTNWPYYFGLLFGLGLTSVAHRTGNWSAVTRLLAGSTRNAPDRLAAECGIDLRSQDFWMAAANQLQERVARFATTASLEQQDQEINPGAPHDH
ncbi:M3 family metallopeptidase [Streptomyces sp. NPDC006335]|uniref:M3 family metallopeptidase n=1 Tax=Streptomyces sp. NPDC006335 TaxID=3156895 RepID=UPI0033A61F52